MSGALLDTSVVVASEAVADQLPEPAAISVITIGELRAGVLRARTDAERGRRAARLDAVRAAFDPLPVDQHVASHHGELLAWAREQSRSEKATDLLITATAAATARTLHTRDKRQASLADAAGIPVELIGESTPPGS